MTYSIFLCFSFFKICGGIGNLAILPNLKEICQTDSSDHKSMVTKSKNKIILFFCEPTEQHPRIEIITKLAYFVKISQCYLFHAARPNQILDKNIFEIFAYYLK